MSLLEKIRRIEGVKKAFVRSGIRHDLVLHDQKSGRAYLKQIIRYHTSGQLKVAPEHSENSVLKYMGKPDINNLLEFKRLFEALCRDEESRQYLTYYLIAAHPGCTHQDMGKLAGFCHDRLKIRPEQVQIFTPTPSTYSSLMYWTQLDPATRRAIFVEKNSGKKELQKFAVTGAPARKRGYPRKTNRQG
jgi:uncharacterized radical SAM protein YgiQ